MANYGFTTIMVRGPESARTDLVGELISTGLGPLRFTRIDPDPEAPTGSEHLQEATIECDDGKLVLRTCLPWGQDVLPLCGSLAHRYPTLGFDGHFCCETTWPDFTVSSHARGRQAYHVGFEARFRAYIHGQPPTTFRQCLIFYPKTAERDAAAADFGPAWTGPLLVRPPVAGSWRRSDHDTEAGVCYLRETEGDAAAAVLFNVHQGNGDVLYGVDPHGGYRASETLGLDDLRAAFPELAGEFADMQEALLCKPEPAVHTRLPHDADDVPF